MRIAIIGSGISGLGAAWMLHRQHDIVLYEAEPRPGGHSNTIDLDYDGENVAVDTGFIVYNEANYPNLTALFSALDVPNVASDMSFAVSVGGGAVEWAGDNLRTVFAQRRNLVRPAFLRMLRDILRFNKRAPIDLAAGVLDGLTLGDYLVAQRYSQPFQQHYLLPMGGAIWSTSMRGMLDFPAQSFITFCENHFLLSRDRPRWRTVAGGSREYVKRLTALFPDAVRLGCPVVRVSRQADGQVAVHDAHGGTAHFDQVILAVHGDQASAMLDAPDAEEAEILGAISYAPNIAYVHRDPALMPRRRGIWASWNYLSAKGAQEDATVAVTYWMNRLQNIDPQKPLFVTLNPPVMPRPEMTFATLAYDHVQYDMRTLRAQRALPSIQGRGGIWYCGAWTAHGFHEDGLRSGIEVAEKLGATCPWERSSATNYKVAAE